MLLIRRAQNRRRHNPVLPSFELQSLSVYRRVRLRWQRPMNEVEECNVLVVVAAASALEKLKKEKEESITLVTRGLKNRSRHDAVLRNLLVHSVEVQSMCLCRGVRLRWQRTMNEAEVMQNRREVVCVVTFGRLHRWMSQKYCVLFRCRPFLFCAVAFLLQHLGL